MRATPARRAAAFTLIELLIVMAIVAVLLTLAVPRYLTSVERSKEAVLRQNLATLRETLDKYLADTGQFPTQLADLVSRKYLRAIPVDPITESAETWVLVGSGDPQRPGIADVRSGAQTAASDGSNFAEW